MSVKSFFMKVVSPILVAGELIESGELIEVLEHEAKALLSRGKALLATEDDMSGMDSRTAQVPDSAKVDVLPGGAPGAATDSLPGTAAITAKEKEKK
jgi:hypothetical protein